MKRVLTRAPSHAPRAAVAAAIALALTSVLAGGCARGRRGPSQAVATDGGGARVATASDRPCTPSSGVTLPTRGRVLEPLPGLRARSTLSPLPAGPIDVAAARTRVLENLGPEEPVPPGPDRKAVPCVEPAVFASANATSWTELVALAFRRDVDLDFEGEPVDLDGDGAPDTTVTRHVHAPGGILANPELFGLVPTPEDPAGTRGAFSISTGVLGLREAYDPEGRPSGAVGMTCFLCHGARNPVDGRVTLGLANTRFDYGLLLATARVLGLEPADVAFRRRFGFPDGRVVRARLLLAGPGRQDLTGEFGLDVTVPGLHSRAYPGTSRVRQKTRGLVNPLSVPSAFGTEGVDLQNWSGSEIASERWLTRLEEASGRPRPELLAAFRLPADDARAARRALLLDLRNLGTLGLQQDSWPGLLFADVLYGLARVKAEDLLPLHDLYAASELRVTLEHEASGLQRPRVDAAAAARGRRLFFDEPAGRIVNLRVLKEPPPAYAASHLDMPVLAPLFAGRPLEAVMTVRCGDCHAATPRETVADFTSNPSPSGRCTSCHRAHPADDDVPTNLDVFLRQTAAAETRSCLACHERHRSFAPISYSNSALLPFDADRDGRAQEDEGDDLAAGGIGTEALLAFDVPRPEWGPEGFHVPVAVIADAKHAGPVKRAALGAGWVRVPSLVGVFATAPYLHNGSVPTLEALLRPPAERPRSFPLGAAGFVLDTRAPGNRPHGHDFGTRWTARQKADVVAFLRTL